MIKSKQFPQTELQEKIYNFWRVRGYEEVTAVLGNLSVSFHRKNLLYEQNGLSYQYLQQFWEEAQKEIYEEIKEDFASGEDAEHICMKYIDRLKKE